MQARTHAQTHRCTYTDTYALAHTLRITSLATREAQTKRGLHPTTRVIPRPPQKKWRLESAAYTHLALTRTDTQLTSKAFITYGALPRTRLKQVRKHFNENNTKSMRTLKTHGCILRGRRLRALCYQSLSWGPMDSSKRCISSALGHNFMTLISCRTCLLGPNTNPAHDPALVL